MSFLKLLKHATAKDSDRTGKQSRSPISHLSLNNSGSRVLNARSDRSLRIWKYSMSTLSDPTIIDNAHAEPVSSTSWHPLLDTNFASVGNDPVVKIWRSNGSLERELSVGAHVGQGGASGSSTKCTIVRYSADGAILLVATESGNIHMYDVSDNYTEITQIKAAETGDVITDIKWTNGGHSWFFVGLESGPILIYEYAEGRVSQLPSILGCRSVTCLLVDPRGRYIAAGSKEGVVSFWHMADMVNFAALTSIDQEISSLATNRDGNYIFVGYAQGSNSRVFDIDTLKECHEIPDSVADTGAVSLVAWNMLRNVLFFSTDKSFVLGYTKRDDRGGEVNRRQSDYGHARSGARHSARK